MKTRSTSGPLLLTLLIAAPISATMAHAQATGPRKVSFGFETNLSAGSPLYEIETTIAANPANPSNIVGGFFHIGLNIDTCEHAYSFDAGRKWTVGSGVPRLEDHIDCGDPAIAADAEGNFYYSYLEGRGKEFPFLDFVDLVVAKSIDGGRTFPTFSVALPGGDFASADKPYLTVDTMASSAHRGTIYLAYTNFTELTWHLDVQVSRDGAAAWTEPIKLSRTIGSQNQDTVAGALPVVAPDATAYVFWADTKVTGGVTAIRFSKSTDGGRTWSPEAAVATNLPTPGFFKLKDANPDFGIRSGAGILGNSFPSAAIAPDGTIYVVWIDFPNGSCALTDPPSDQDIACVNSDVRLSLSKDAGKTWTAPVKVSDEKNATDQFLPWIGVHPDGLVSIAWTDKRLDPNNANYDVFYTNTADGRRFLPNVRVTSRTSVVGTNCCVKDYNGLTATKDHVFVTWMDQRDGGDSDVFVARGTLR